MISTDLIVGIVAGVVIVLVVAALVRWLMRTPGDPRARTGSAEAGPVGRKKWNFDFHVSTDVKGDADARRKENVGSTSHSFSMNLSPELLDMIRNGREEDVVNRLCREHGMGLDQARQIVGMMGKMGVGGGEVTVSERSVETPAVTTRVFKVNSRTACTIPNHIIEMAKNGGVEPAAVRLSQELDMELERARAMLTALMKHGG